MRYALDCRRHTATGRTTFLSEWHPSLAEVDAAMQHHQAGHWDSIDVWEVPDEAPRDLSKQPQLHLPWGGC